MARGAKWQIAGALWHPNYQWYDSDYDQTANENIPDDWEKESPPGGTLTLNIRGGWDSLRGLQVIHSGSAGATDTIRSGRGLRGAIPLRENFPLNQGRLWVRGRYALNASGALLTPIVTFYNANESLSFDNALTPAAIAGGLSNFQLYSESVVVPLNAGDIGFWPTHARLRFQFFLSGASTRVWGLGRWTVGYSLPSYAGGSQGYDEIICRPVVDSIDYGIDTFGVLSDMPNGGVRLIDRTAGAERQAFRAAFNQARINDKNIFDLAWALRRGSFSTRGTPGVNIAPHVTQSPIVLYPNVYDDGNFFLDGRDAPEGMYAWIVSRPQWAPVAFLGNAWRGAIDFLEAT